MNLKGVREANMEPPKGSKIILSFAYHKRIKLNHKAIIDLANIAEIPLLQA